MRRTATDVIIGLVLACLPTLAAADDPAPGARSMLNLETEDLPQGRVRINGIERVHPPGARTPWHTSGPKFLHVLEGTLTAYGTGGKALLECGPAPKLCLLSPQNSLWYFRNRGTAPVRFLLIGIDPVARPTVHEEVGQVVSVSGNRVTVAVGDLRTSGLAVPRREISVTLPVAPAISIGDDVVTVRHDEKSGTAERLIKLAERWQ